MKFGLTVCLGITAVFLSLGILMNYLGKGMLKYSGWVELASGIILITIGLFYLFKLEEKFRISRVINIGEKLKSIKIKNKNLSSFLYGAGFSIASIGCALPVFLLIHHIHQDLFRSGLYFPMDKIALVLEGKLMPLVYRNSRIITVSESSRKDILALGFFKSKNISVVNPGIDPAIFFTSPKTRYPSFVYLGRIRAQKNIDVAIRAFASVVRKHPKARLSIAGWGDKIDELIKLTKSLKLAKSVKFLGKTSDKDRVKLLGRSWAMLQPSSLEGWGITVIEANACGTPVIASDVPGLRDSVLHDESGFLVPAKNEFALAEAMKVLIDLPDHRARLSQNAIAWSHNFNWDVKSAEFICAISNCRQEPELDTPIHEPAPAYARAS